MDVKSIAYRATWGMPTFWTPDSRNITPVYGTLRLLLSLLRWSGGVTGIAFCCDPCVPTQNWRYQLFPDYKSNRKNLAQNNQAQAKVRAAVEDTMDLMRELLTCLPCTWLEDPEYEADDMVAWAAGHYLPNEQRAIWTTDRDQLQLINWPNVHVIHPAHKHAKFVIINAQNFQAHGNIVMRGKTGNAEGRKKPENIPPPDYWLAFKCIVGDKSDSIPGVPGLGPVFALQVIELGRTRTDSRDPRDLLLAWLDIRLQEPRDRKMVSRVFLNKEANLQILERNMKLMQLHPDNAIQCRRGSFHPTMRWDDFYRKLSDLNMRSLLPGGEYHSDVELYLPNLRAPQ